MEKILSHLFLQQSFFLWNRVTHDFSSNITIGIVWVIFSESSPKIPPTQDCLLETSFQGKHWFQRKFPVHPVPAHMGPDHQWMEPRIGSLGFCSEAHLDSTFASLAKGKSSCCRSGEKQMWPEPFKENIDHTGLWEVLACSFSQVGLNPGFACSYLQAVFLKATEDTSHLGNWSLGYLFSLVKTAQGGGNWGWGREIQLGYQIYFLKGDQKTVALHKDWRNCDALKIYTSCIFGPSPNYNKN